MPIQVACGSCAKRFQAGDKLAGRRVKCPKCQGFIDIPANQPVRAAAAASPRAPAAGASAAVATTPAATKTAPPPATAAAPAAPSMLGLLDEEAVPVQRRCPACGRPLGPTDVLCVGCGHDARTGRRVERGKVEKTPDAPPAAGLAKAASTAGRATASFVKGVACSVAAVLVGAAIWYFVAVGTGYELGLIAWGLGVLAGIGMRLGYGKEDDVAGITAAFVACFGIFAAKWMIFSNLILPNLGLLRAAGVLDGDATSTAGLFFKTCFGIIDGLFILFAFASAYKVGTGKASDD